MANIILMSLIFGYFAYVLYRIIRKKDKSCCNDCNCPIKEKMVKEKS